MSAEPNGALASPRPELGRSPRALVVDDSELAGRLLAAHLGRVGAEASVRPGGSAAREALAGARFDLVVVQPDGLDPAAMELVRELRRGAFAGGSGTAPGVPVLAVAERLEEAAAWREAGATDCAPDPLDPAGVAALAVRLASGGAPEPSADREEFDPAALARLLEGDRAKVARFAERFLVTARASIEELRVAREAGDLSALAMVGHRLSSSADSAGARRLAAGCRELERAALAGDRPAALALVLELSERFDRVAARVRQERW